MLRGTPYFKNKDNRTDGQFYFGKCLLALDKNYSGELKIRQNTTYIADGIFSNCKNLTGVSIPKSVRYFNVADYGENNFWACPKLEKITVEKGNKYFSSADGILFNKKQTVLFRYPSAKSGKTYSVPKKVKKIAPVAFEGSKYLTAVSFNKNAKCSIGDLAFLNCKSIKSMTVPKNVYTYECPGMGLYRKSTKYVDYTRMSPSSVKGFVLKGYASNETVSEYAAVYELNYVTLCKNGKAHKTESVKAKKATYFSTGYKAYERCTVCGEKIGFEKLEKKVLAAPQVKVTAGNGTIKVKYTAVKGATGFTVRYVDKAGKKVAKAFTADTSKTVTISGVKKGEYSVYVMAFVKSAGKTAYSPRTATSTVNVK